MLSKIFHIVIFSFLIVNIGYSQEFSDDCIYIDFETIPEGTLVDGMDIFDQYSERYGVRFSLEDGSPVKLAKVGAPATAFGSADGLDTPLDGVDIGEYFLTDDGQLSGLESTPIFINFDFPIDSVSGCILDMDFLERFVVTAFGEFGDAIFVDTIFAGLDVVGQPFIEGDPGTGDGLCTPWGFRLDDCAGLIYSVKLDGFRDFQGEFGLGVDHLSFCKFGATPFVDFEINQTDIICGNGTGSISVNTLSGEEFQYSINGGPYEIDPVYSDLPEGTYEITVLNELGCEDVYPVSIDIIPVPEIMTVDNIDTKCGLDNGSIALEVEGGLGEIQYTLDGQNFVTDGQFSNLPPGDYTVFITDALGCTDFVSVNIAASPGPVISGVEQEDASCDLANGEITIGAVSSTPFIEYSLNDGPWQTSSDFADLAPGDDYMITIRDAEGCIADTIVSIGEYPLIELRDVIETQPECLLDNGTITVTYDGGVGDVQYSIDGGFSYQFSNVFTGLAPGFYQIILKDEKGCELLVDALVPPYKCPVYVGNIFAPNNNGANEFFPVITSLDYPATIIRYSIYDRWGELIYDAENFSIHDNSYYWDGTFQGKTAVFGVYVYLIQVGHLDGSTEYLSGDVTMIK